MVQGEPDMSEPVRILHVIGRMDRGGAETFIMNVYRNIDRSKIQFDFMVHTEDKCSYDDEIINLGGKIFRVPRYNGVNHLKYKSEWRKFFENNKSYKIIHGHMTSTGAIYLKIAKKYGMTTISHVHSTSSLGKGLTVIVKDIIERRSKNSADYLFACSEAAGKWCYGNDVCEKSNFHVIRNAVDTEKFIYNPVIRDLKRKELGIENKYIIGHVGNFTVPKNHSFMIDIFKKVHEKNYNAVLLLAGGGALREDIEKKVEVLGLHNSVVFAGVRSDIPDLLCAMDVFLFPSLWEGLGIALVEAQASGLHCITSEAVPQEAKVTDLLEYVPIKESASYWAEKVLTYGNGYERKNTKEDIKKAGYDIKELVSWLEDFYLKCY